MLHVLELPNGLHLLTKCVSNDSEIFQLKGIGLFTIEDAEDSLEDREAPVDTINNDDKLKCSET